jgi:hypothetical protein
MGRQRQFLMLMVRVLLIIYGSQIAPVPDVLSRNDIIIRMYWDGNEYPSVESPIGPGQGWEEFYEFTSLPLAAGPKEGRGLVSYFAMRTSTFCTPG